MKILGIYGSPRKGGNTDILLDNFLVGCEGWGAAVGRLMLRGLSFGPCTECGGCSSTGECIIEDGMKEVYPLLRESAGIVLASPIFFYGLTALAKAFIDRMQPFYVEKYILGRKHSDSRKKKGFFISVGATKGQRLFDGTILTVKYFYDALGADYAGDILYRNIEGKGDISKMEGALGDALEKGKWFAAQL